MRTFPCVRVCGSFLSAEGSPEQMPRLRRSVWHISEEHVSIMGAEASRLRLPLGYVGTWQERPRIICGRGGRTRATSLARCLRVCNLTACPPWLLGRSCACWSARPHGCQSPEGHNPSDTPTPKWTWRISSHENLNMESCIISDILWLVFIDMHCSQT
jgi:hypothetical protein